jgi:hypothetical protein
MVIIQTHGLGLEVDKFSNYVCSKLKCQAKRKELTLE